MAGDRYPLNPSDDRAMLEQRFRDIEQQLSALGNRTMRHSVLPEGSITILNAAGDRVLLIDNNGLSMYDPGGDLRARIGLVDGTHYGLISLDDDGTTQRLWVDDRGLHSPYLSAPLVDADTDFKAITSATFVASHRAQFESISHQGLYCWVTATAPAGTTGEIRLRNVGTGATTAAVAVPDGGQVTQQFRWLHGSTLSAGPVTFEVQARRTGGAGNINVYRAPGMWMTGPGLCVTDGVP